MTTDELLALLGGIFDQAIALEAASTRARVDEANFHGAAHSLDMIAALRRAHDYIGYRIASASIIPPPSAPPAPDLLVICKRAARVTDLGPGAIEDLENAAKGLLARLDGAGPKLPSPFPT